VVNLYEYSVYGEVSASDPNHPNRFLFTGREFDADTGLYYYRARYYNPYIGRFLQTDPVGGTNLYPYCSNNPTNRMDPSGCYDSSKRGLHNDGGFYHIHFTCPVDAMFPLAAAMAWSDTGLTEKVEWWLDTQFDAFSAHPGWSVWSGKLAGDQLDIVIGWGGLENPVTVPPPAMAWHTARIVKDNSYISSGQADATVVDTVYFIDVDKVWLLDARTDGRVVKPAIAEIDSWDRAYTGTYWMWEHLINDWDSWFRADDSAAARFKWTNQKVYDGRDINYVVGGYAFAYYGFPESWAWACVVGRKGLQCDLTTNLDAVGYWFSIGYGAVRDGWPISWGIEN